MAAPDLFATSLCPEEIAPRRADRRVLSRELFVGAVACAEAPADFLAAALGFLAAFVLCARLPIHGLVHSSARESLALSAIFGLLVAVLMQRDRGRRSGSGLLRVQETERSIRVSLQALVLVAAINYLLGLGVPWSAFLTGAITAPVLLMLQKQIFLACGSRLQRSGRGFGRVAVYGGGSVGRGVVSTLLHSPRLGFHPVAVIEDRPTWSGYSLPAMGYRNRTSVPIRSGPLTPALLESLQCDMLLVATPDLSHEELEAARRAAFQADADVALFAGLTVPEQQTEVFEADGFLFSSNIERPDPWHYSVCKRATDLVVSCLLLILLAPLFLLIAILIRLDSPGSALFVQKRVGRGGEIFEMFKFRSMHVDAPSYSASPTSSSDARITRIGRFLRRMNLDELPQLLNVFLGTMSLVGPRPEMPFLVEQNAAAHRERLRVIPGITGLWQLSADRSFPIHQNVEYDLYYIRNRSFVLDLAILAHTLFYAVGGGV
jgi:exopolysaccharide biosynthesis polyprenyl glycosylphosphotransferase